MAKTTIYQFNSKGDLKRVKILSVNDLEVKVWKRGKQINYTVSKGGRILYGASLLEGELALCAYCHQQIEDEPEKLGVLNFHWYCYLNFFFWQRKIRPSHPRRRRRAKSEIRVNHKSGEKRKPSKKAKRRERRKNE